MDRREMLKGAGGSFAAASLGMSGLSESVASGPRIVDTGPYRGMSTHLAGYDPNARWPGDPVPYDPVAVLEAMRERGVQCSLKMNDDIEGWSATWPTRGMSLEGREFPATCTRFNIPDFTSAARWLHKQAAAADPSFAEAWPVPEGE